MRVSWLHAFDFCKLCISHRDRLEPRMWFKGADTYSVCKFIEAKFRDLDGDRLYFDCIHLAAKGGNCALSELYSNGLWLRPSQAVRVANASMACLLRYRECAQLAFARGKCRFKLPPKFHAFTHIAHGVIEQLGNVGDDRLATDQPSILNPLSYCCQQDEEFVGQLAILSRTANAGYVHEGTANKYLYNLAQHW